MTEEVSSKLAEVGQLKGEIADKLFEELLLMTISTKCQ